MDEHEIEQQHERLHDIFVDLATYFKDREITSREAVVTMASLIGRLAGREIKLGDRVEGARLYAMAIKLMKEGRDFMAIFEAPADETTADPSDPFAKPD